jgi:hypothetical protein
MNARVLFFTQPGCLSCELMRVVLEAKAIAFEERDIRAEKYDSYETPTLVLIAGETEEVVIGFDPERLDQWLDPAPSSDSVTES